MLLIVDGVLIPTHQTHRKIFKYVKLLENIDTVLVFPWGRESFLKTISTMRPGKKYHVKCDDPVKVFTIQLQQQTFCMTEFPLALQLLALSNISRLLQALHGGSDSQNFFECSAEELPNQPNFHLKEIHHVERQPEVTSFTYPQHHY